MSYASIDDLRSQLGATRRPADEAYAKKQLHEVPDAPLLNRKDVILERVTGKRVLEFGASGPMHEAIVKAASDCVGVDREDGQGVIGFDLDDVSRQRLPPIHDDEDRDVNVKYDVIVCGEVLEHLSNPGWFLTRLRRQYPNVPVLITVPNAHSLSGLGALQNGIENVNIDHVSWYSYRTLRTLLERVGYTMTLVGWYNGTPLTAEGLIVLAE